MELAAAAERFIERRSAFEASWDRTLAYLVTDDLSFEEAFTETARLLGSI